jgi:hypothetical protein
MEEQYDKLNLISSNKTLVFYSPVEGDDILVRTGNVFEDLTFFHCFLQSYSKKYHSMTDKDKDKFALNLYKIFIKKTHKQQIFDKEKFKNKLIENLTEFYEFINNEKIQKLNDNTKTILKKISKINKNIQLYYKLITQLFCLDEDFVENILNHDDNSFKDYSEKILYKTILFLKNKKEIQTIDKNKSIYIIEIVTQFLKIFIQETEKYTNRKQKKKINNNVSLEILDFISNKFKINIFIIDSVSRMPFTKFFHEKNIKSRNSIIMMYHEKKNKYESVGKLLSGNKIKRNFNHSDIIIDKIITLLMYPEKIHKKYKDLEVYLDKKYENNSDISDYSDNSDDEYLDSELESVYSEHDSEKEDSDKEDSDKEDSDKEDSDKEDSDKEDSDKEDSDKE